jgi:hypothetical protein
LSFFAAKCFRQGRQWPWRIFSGWFSLTLPFGHAQINRKPAIGFRSYKDAAILLPGTGSNKDGHTIFPLSGLTRGELMIRIFSREKQTTPKGWGAKPLA